MTVGLALQGATKRFGTDPVFADLDLDVEDGSFTVLVGPSGCGSRRAFACSPGWNS